MESIWSGTSRTEDDAGSSVIYVLSRTIPGRKGIGRDLAFGHHGVSIPKLGLSTFPAAKDGIPPLGCTCSFPTALGFRQLGADS